MGLDMYAYKTLEPVEAFGFKEPEDAEEIQYWRKHPNLHGWMEQLYRSKGGLAKFNLTTVRIDEADIDALEDAVRNDRLPETVGFFFGTSRPEEKDDDLKFITAARAALKDGYRVFYSSWW
jgi:hypothetical protein